MLWRLVVTVAAVLAALPGSAAAVALSDSLAILAPLVGRTWVGEMTSPDGKQSWPTERTFQAIWDGSVVRFTSSTRGMTAEAEGFFYWDREAGKVAVFIVNQRGIHQRGTVTREDGALKIEGRIVFPDRAFDYRNTFEEAPGGKLIDRWFQNAFGPWRPGHVIELTPREP